MMASQGRQGRTDGWRLARLAGPMARVIFSLLLVAFTLSIARGAYYEVGTLSQQAGRRKVAKRAWQGLLRVAGRAAHIAFTIVMIGVTVVLGGALLVRVLGYQAFAVTGGSMADALPVGTVALTRTVPAAEVSVGDVILASRTDDGESSLPVAHRVIDIDDEDTRLVMYTKGDANAAADPAPNVVPPDGHLPRVEAHIPYAGYLVNFVQTPTGWALLVLVPLGVLALRLVTDIWGAGTKRNRSRPSIWRWFRWVV